MAVGKEGRLEVSLGWKSLFILESAKSPQHIISLPNQCLLSKSKKEWGNGAAKPRESKVGATEGPGTFGKCEFEWRAQQGLF